MPKEPVSKISKQILSGTFLKLRANPNSGVNIWKLHAVCIVLLHHSYVQILNLTKPRKLEAHTLRGNLYIFQCNVSICCIIPSHSNLNYIFLWFGILWSIYFKLAHRMFLICTRHKQSELLTCLVGLELQSHICSILIHI